MKVINSILSLCLVILLFISGCSPEDNVTGNTVTDTYVPSTNEGVNPVQVESKYVCMINQNVYEQEQILVEVDGLNYYGCCMECKAKLLNDPSTRVAIDPVSGNQVDKALAIIGECNGKAYYFETLNNLQNYDC